MIRMYWYYFQWYNIVDKEASSEKQNILKFSAEDAFYKMQYARALSLYTECLGECATVSLFTSSALLHIRITKWEEKYYSQSHDLTGILLIESNPSHIKEEYSLCTDLVRLYYSRICID